jgi:uncharacterized metal-binding protein YceD (DUF177 family)
MLTPSELPQTIRWEAVPPTGYETVIHADAGALDALAKRMKIPAILEFTCGFALRRGPLGTRVVTAEGRLRARVVLTCVVTLDAFEALIDEPFEVRFVPSHEMPEQPDPDDIDEVPYEDGVLPLGEAAAEQLALSLPAFPRSPGAETSEEAAFFTADEGYADLVEQQVDTDRRLTPFSVLAARRKPV